MKKLFYVAMVSGAILLFSCQQKPAEQPAQQAQPQEQAQKPAEQPAPQAEQKPAEQPKAEQQPAQQATAQVKDMQAFAQQKGCFACHDVNAKKVGPSYKEIAGRYAGKPGAIEELAKAIKNGVVGEWGKVPMPPQNVTDQEAKELARWVLSFK